MRSFAPAARVEESAVEADKTKVVAEVLLNVRRFCFWFVMTQPSREGVTAKMERDSLPEPADAFTDRRNEATSSSTTAVPLVPIPDAKPAK